MFQIGDKVVVRSRRWYAKSKLPGVVLDIVDCPPGAGYTGHQMLHVEHEDGQKFNWLSFLLRKAASKSYKQKPPTAEIEEEFF